MNNMKTEVRYQVWIRDAHLAGHITVDEDASIEEISDLAHSHAREVWDKDVVYNDVSVCRISPTYYQDIEQASAKDSIVLGM